MLDHIGFGVSDYGKSKNFYIHALSPLGIEVVMEVSAEQTGDKAHCGFGSGGKAYFWISQGPMARTHLAFAAQARGDVDSFYKSAMAAGGTDNGAPGPRPHYSADYYGAFVLDPDGNNIEANCRVPA